MTTETIFTVGATSRDYASLDAVLADIGIGLSNDLVTDDVNYIFELYNDAIFQHTGNLTFASAWGTGKCDATRNVVIRPASGEGVFDNITYSDALKLWGVSKGVHLNFNTNNYRYIALAEYMVMEGLQISRNLGSGAAILGFDKATALIKNCIFDLSKNAGGAALRLSSAQKENCIVFHGETSPSGPIVGVASGTTQKNVTVLRYSDAATDVDTVGIGAEAGQATPSLINCASFGHATDFGTGTLTNCASSDATGSTGLINLTTTDEFEGIASSAPDGRLKSTSNLIGAGSTSGASTDIYGTTRDVSTPDVGAFEYVGGNSPPTGSVTISGTVAVGETLTASNTIADADGLGTITYQWLLDDAPISGETGTTYTILNTDVGGVIKVVASYTDGGGTPESKTSSGTIAVPNTSPTGSPTISGTKTEGQTLTVDTSGIADADTLGSFSYQWLRDDVAISGATSSTYVLTAFDVATVIKCKVSYTDGGGTTEELTSSGYSPIAAASATTYQRCYFPVVIDPTFLDNSISGDPSFTNFVVDITEADIPAAFMNGGSQSAENGGGNIRVYTSTDLTDASRLAISVAFDINAGTANIKALLPMLPVATGDTLYLAKGDPTDTQPGAATTYGSDAVDTYDPDLVPPTDPSDLKTTYDNQDTEADFMAAGSLVCSLIGGSSSEGNTPRQGLRHASFNALHGGDMRTYNEDIIAGCLANDGTITATTLNGILFEWLDNLGYSQTTLQGKMNAFAVARGHHNWTSMGSFTV